MGLGCLGFWSLGCIGCMGLGFRRPRGTNGMARTYSMLIRGWRGDDWVGGGG